MVRNVYQRLSIGACLLFISMAAGTAQNPPLNSQTSSTRGSIVIPGIPVQGENFLKDSMKMIPDDQEFQIGGSVVFPPSGGICKTLTATQGVKIAPVMGCGGLNAVASIGASFKDAAKGILGSFAQIQQTATGLISALPLIIIAQLSPTLYAVLTNSISANITEMVGMDIPSCQDIKREIDTYQAQGVEGGDMLASMWNKHKNVAKADAFASYEIAGKKKSGSVKDLLSSVEKDSDDKIKKGVLCPDDRPRKDCMTVSTKEMLSAALKQLNAIQNDGSACLGVNYNNPSLLQQYLGTSPGTMATDDQIKEIVDWMARGNSSSTGVLGEATITISDTADTTSMEPVYTSGADLSILRHLMEADVARELTAIIGTIQKRDPTVATDADVSLLKTKTAWAYPAGPIVLGYIARKTKEDDKTVALLQAELISQLALVKTVTAKRLFKQVIDRVAGDNSYKEYPILEALAKEYIVEKFNKMVALDEAKLSEEDKKAREEVAATVKKILELKDERDKKAAEPQKSGRPSY